MDASEEKISEPKDMATEPIKNETESNKTGGMNVLSVSCGTSGRPHV